MSDRHLDFDTKWCPPHALVKCAVCKKRNIPNQTVCVDCGHHPNYPPQEPAWPISSGTSSSQPTVG